MNENINEIINVENIENLFEVLEKFRGTQNTQTIQIEIQNDDKIRIDESLNLNGLSNISIQTKNEISFSDIDLIDDKSASNFSFKGLVFESDFQYEKTTLETEDYVLEKFTDRNIVFEDSSEDFSYVHQNYSFLNERINEVINLTEYHVKESDVVIKNKLFFGDRECGSNEYESIAVSIRGCDKITIENCIFQNWGTAISVHDSSNVTIKNCHILDMAQDGVSALRVRTIKIENNYIYNFCPNYWPNVIGNNVEAFQIENDKILHGSLVGKKPIHADLIQLTNTDSITIQNNKLGIFPYENELSDDHAWTQSILIKYESWRYYDEKAKTNVNQNEAWSLDEELDITIVNNLIRNRHLHGITLKDQIYNNITQNIEGLNQIVFGGSENVLNNCEDIYFRKNQSKCAQRSPSTCKEVCLNLILPRFNES